MTYRRTTITCGIVFGLSWELIPEAFVFSEEEERIIFLEFEDGKLIVKHAGNAWSFVRREGYAELICNTQDIKLPSYISVGSPSVGRCRYVCDTPKVSQKD